MKYKSGSEAGGFVDIVSCYVILTMLFADGMCIRGGCNENQEDHVCHIDRYGIVSDIGMWPDERGCKG